MGTRPDIAHSLSVLGQFAANPGRAHWAALKRVCRYLKGSPLMLQYGNVSVHPDISNRFGHKEDIGRPLVVGYTDADFANEPDCKSFSAYAFLMAGAAVSWACRKQTTTVLSTTEAECVAAALACREALWIRHLLSQFQTPPSLPLLADNQGTIKLAHNAEFHARTKHINIKHHFIRECIKEKLIILAYVRTEDMAADCLSKSLKPSTAQLRAVAQLGLTKQV
ncbi:gag-pol polyprotein [Ceraceosorus bombacis]|uniref:Gag-pol polyprotein n=1 Tax=Ceraceosorus bombacis TaxID=401625 RepID=A0A0P1BJA8_9BASI|nr:gag-pol polyprotein [Ceraceosorus bombacis]